MNDCIGVGLDGVHYLCECQKRKLDTAEAIAKAAMRIELHLMGECECSPPAGTCFRKMRDLLVNNDLFENYASARKG